MQGRSSNWYHYTQTPTNGTRHQVGGELQLASEVSSQCNFCNARLVMFVNEVSRDLRSTSALAFVIWLGTAADPLSTDGSERGRRRRSTYRDRHAFPFAATKGSSPQQRRPHRPVYQTGRQRTLACATACQTLLRCGSVMVRVLESMGQAVSKRQPTLLGAVVCLLCDMGRLDL